MPKGIIPARQSLVFKRAFRPCQRAYPSRAMPTNNHFVVLPLSWPLLSSIPTHASLSQTDHRPLGQLESLIIITSNCLARRAYSPLGLKPNSPVKFTFVSICSLIFRKLLQNKFINFFNTS